MEWKDMGGAAFPVQDSEKYHPEPGMSLRDYLAANAPQYALDIDGWTASECAAVLGVEKYDFRTHYAALLSKLAYEYADAMLKAREKSGD